MQVFKSFFPLILMFFIFTKPIFAINNPVPSGAALVLPEDLPFHLKKHEILLFGGTYIQETLILYPFHSTPLDGKQVLDHSKKYLISLEHPEYDGKDDLDFSSPTLLKAVLVDGELTNFTPRHLYIFNGKDITEEVSCLGNIDPDTIRWRSGDEGGIIPPACMNKLATQGYIEKNGENFTALWKGKTRYVFEISNIKNQPLVISLTYRTRIQFEPYWEDSKQLTASHFVFGKVCPERARHLKLKTGMVIRGVSAWNLALHRRAVDKDVPVDLRLMKMEQNYVSCLNLKKDGHFFFTRWKPGVPGWSKTIFAEDGFSSLK